MEELRDGDVGWDGQAGDLELMVFQDPVYPLSRSSRHRQSEFCDLLPAPEVRGQKSSQLPSFSLNILGIWFLKLNSVSETVGCGLIV